MAKESEFVVPKSVQRVLDDLLDAHEVAELLGVSSATSVTVYAARYDHFPRPVRKGAPGRCALWLRAHIVQWRDAHPPRPRSEPNAEHASEAAREEGQIPPSIVSPAKRRVIDELHKVAKPIKADPLRAL